MENPIWSECDHQAFIGTYKNVVDKKFCDDLIQFFENSIDREDLNYYTGEQQYGGPFIRKDFSLNLESAPETKWSQHINDVLFKCLDEYKNVFFVCKQVHNLDYTNTYVKMQRTPPRGGYHVWHCEVNSIAGVDRVLAWILYLNDVPYGEGETEFLWQGIRIQPEVGKLVIWPAQFTHTHRGNPIYNCTKYIATGWIEYTGVRKNNPESPVIYNEEHDFAVSKKPQLSNWDENDDNNDHAVFIPDDLDIVSVDFGDRKI
jgi:hypothetical protein